MTSEDFPVREALVTVLTDMSLFFLLILIHFSPDWILMLINTEKKKKKKKKIKKEFPKNKNPDQRRSKKVNFARKYRDFPEKIVIKKQSE